MTATEHQHSEARPDSEHPAATAAFERLLLDVPSDAGPALAKAKERLQSAKQAVEEQYMTATESDFECILETLGDAYRRVARLERSAIPQPTSEL